MARTENSGFEMRGKKSCKFIDKFDKLLKNARLKAAFNLIN